MGLFIHWAILHQWCDEWKRQRLSIEEYEQYFEEFNPVDFNPREWAK